MNNLFSLDNQLSLRGSLGFIKYVLLFLALVTFFEQNFITTMGNIQIMVFKLLSTNIWLLCLIGLAQLEHLVLLL